MVLSWSELGDFSAQRDRALVVGGNPALATTTLMGCLTPAVDREAAARQRLTSHPAAVSPRRA
jgi:hypothetical protein